MTIVPISGIPKIFHLTIATREIPARYMLYRDSWLNQHPGWHCVIWSDDDLRALISQRDPDFLSTFDGYSEGVRRADAGRYFIMKYIGGVYVDFDFECLKPISGLIDGAPLAIGLEPESHTALPKARERRLERVLCPSFIASEPGHPFWDSVLAALKVHKDQADTLDATGPFLLTRTYDAFADRRAIRLLAPGTIYPVDRMMMDDPVFDIVDWEGKTRNAHAIHHWDGTWWRRPEQRQRLPQAVRIRVSDHGTATRHPPGSTPLISCLMVTRNRHAYALNALECFRRQSYGNKEMIIVDGSDDDALVRRLSCEPGVRIFRQPDGPSNLGRVRNFAVSLARGEYVCQWDDDDLSDPLRLELQMKALQVREAQACMLLRWLIWWPDTNRFVLSVERAWEGSLLCEKAVMPTYPELERAEDTPAIEDLIRRTRVAFMDIPRLYVYCVHGKNTWDDAHFEPAWKTARVRFEGERAHAIEKQLSLRLPMSSYPKRTGVR